MKDVESVKSIREQLAKLGAMLPGKINIQWTQCKTKGCKCMDKKNPRKHGPYNQLSFSFAGKSSTMNIKEKDMKKAQQCIDNYKHFQELCKQLVLANVREIRQDGFKKKK